MKKTILFAIIFLTTWIAKAQNTFAPVGAEWWHYLEVREWNGANGQAQTNYTFNTKSVKDTVVNNIPCRLLQTTKQMEEPGNFVPTPVYTKDFLFYDNQDTAFIYNENFNRFTPLYVFNAQDGDTICLPLPPDPHAHDLQMNPISGDTSFCFVVDSVRIRLYDTAHLKTFYTHPLLDGQQGQAFSSYNWGPGESYSNTPLTGMYIERIIGNFLPVRVIYCVDCWSTNYAPFGDLRCYNDGQYSVKLRPEACDSLPIPPPLSISNASAYNKTIRVFPNPSTGHFTIELQQPFSSEASVWIRDMSGREILRSSIAAGKSAAQISMDQIPAGIYFLSIITDHSSFNQKIINRN